MYAGHCPLTCLLITSCCSWMLPITFPSVSTLRWTTTEETVYLSKGLICTETDIMKECSPDPDTDTANFVCVSADADRCDQWYRNANDNARLWVFIPLLVMWVDFKHIHLHVLLQWAPSPSVSGKQWQCKYWVSSGIHMAPGDKGWSAWETHIPPLTSISCLSPTRSN